LRLDQERIFDEFNKLSVLYGIPADMFINLNLKSDDKPATEAEGIFPASPCFFRFKLFEDPFLRVIFSGQGGDGSETLVSNSESSEQSVVPVTKVDTVDFLDVSSAPVHATPAPVSVAKPAEQFDLFVRCLLRRFIFLLFVIVVDANSTLNSGFDG
jgi:hypothetical protein